MQARCLHDCRSSDPSELSFLAGDVILSISPSAESGWYTGTLKNNTGLFPINYVVLEASQKKQPPPLPKTKVTQHLSETGNSMEQVNNASLKSFGNDNLSRQTQSNNNINQASINHGISYSQQLNRNASISLQQMNRINRIQPNNIGSTTSLRQKLGGINVESKSPPSVADTSISSLIQSSISAKKLYCRLFQETVLLKDCISGSQVRSIWLKSKLDIGVLSRIWRHVDVQGAGSLNESAFCVGMSIIDGVLAGIPLYTLLI